jgi:hypothetical protein
MTTLSDAAKDFQNFANSLNAGVRSTLEEEARVLRDGFAKDTPVLTGRLKQSWRVKKNHKGNNIIAGVQIYNPQPYGGYLDQGVSIENKEHPWVKARSKKGSKPKGTAEQSGKVWSKKAKGGITPKTLTPSYVVGLTRRIADSIVRGFK